MVTQAYITRTFKVINEYPNNLLKKKRNMKYNVKIQVQGQQASLIVKANNPQQVERIIRETLSITKVCKCDTCKC